MKASVPPSFLPSYFLLSFFTSFCFSTLAKATHVDVSKCIKPKMLN